MPVTTAEKTKAKRAIMRLAKPQLLALGFQPSGRCDTGGLFTLIAENGDQLNFGVDVSSSSLHFRPMTHWKATADTTWIQGPHCHAGGGIEPNGVRYSFAFRRDDEGHERCAANIVNWVRDVALPWFVRRSRINWDDELFGQHPSPFASPPRITSPTEIVPAAVDRPKIVRIRKLIATMMKEFFPEAVEFEHTRPGYSYRSVRRPPYYELIQIRSSQKERLLECDVAWGFFPTWNGQYGTHSMIAATGLANLCLTSSAADVMDHVVMHDGSESGIQAALARIGLDLRQYSRCWFDAHSADADNDRILQFGLQWLRERWDSVPIGIQDEIDAALSAVDYRRHRVRHPLVVALKEDLRTIAHQINASVQQRKDTGVLAFHLLEYADLLKNERRPGL